MGSSPSSTPTPKPHVLCPHALVGMSFHATEDPYSIWLLHENKMDFPTEVEILKKKAEGSPEGGGGSCRRSSPGGSFPASTVSSKFCPLLQPGFVISGFPPLLKMAAS